MTHTGTLVLCEVSICICANIFDNLMNFKLASIRIMNCEDNLWFEYHVVKCVHWMNRC